MFCVLDIESSGGPFGKEAIIEIALFKYDGQEVVDQLISLVHPHRAIQPFVSKITGITEKMLVRAPRFHEIAKRIVEITEGCILVGHNAPFDYRMLRQEFGRLGYTYERKILDTIPLCEELIPGLPAYGLDKVTKELGIYNPAKHRAEGDARATLELFKILQEKDRKKEIGILGQSIVANDYTEDKVNDLLRSVKKNKGLYYLHNAKGDLLYLGLSENIKGSLSKLLIADNEKGKSLRHEAQSVRVEPTGNMLVAVVKKHEEIKETKPFYNPKEKLTFPMGLYVDDRHEKLGLLIKPLSEMGKKRPVCKVENFQKGLRIVRMFKRVYSSASAREAILSKIKRLPDQIIFVGKGRETGERCAFVINQRTFSGYLYFHLNQQLGEQEVIDASLAPIKDQKAAVQWLKQYVLMGEVREF